MSHVKVFRPSEGEHTHTRADESFESLSRTFRVIGRFIVKKNPIDADAHKIVLFRDKKL